MDEQRRLMDELMGVERNLNEADKNHHVRHFSDPDVCKFYLCGVSPYSLFTNTKSDLGPYDKVFDDDCKAAYEAVSQAEKDRLGYEYECMVLLERLVAQCDQKVKRHMDRVRQEHAEELRGIGTALLQAEYERVGECDEAIKRAEGGAEVEGSALSLALAGRVDESLALLNRCEQWRREMTQLESKALHAAREVKGGKSMLVCEVSGNYMNSTDNGDRLKCHFEGKQYQGWKLIREKLKLLRQERPPPPGGSSGMLGGSSSDRAYRSDDRSRDKEEDRRRDDRSRGSDDRRDDDRGRGGSGRDRDSDDRRRRDDYSSRGSERRRSRSRSRDRRRR
jgi:hypothetical protein